jgi:two-component sensor histidine kinase
MNNKQTMPSYLVELEHELADAHDRIRLLVAERNTARLQADQKINLREEFRELLGTDDIEQGVVVVRELQDRIKRLEEVGDALCENSNPSRWDSPADAARKLTEQSNWHKAKEAKP